VFTSKYKVAKELVIERVKVVLKDISAKRMNLFKTAGVDENTEDVATMFLQGVDELVG